MWITWTIRGCSIHSLWEEADVLQPNNHCIYKKWERRYPLQYPTQPPQDNLFKPDPGKVVIRLFVE